MTFRVPYGKSHLEFDLPLGFRGTLLESRRQAGLIDPLGAISRALAIPVGSARLAELARPGMKVVVVVTDVTRACPDNLLVPPILDELAAAGVPERDVTVVVGIGMHRPSTAEDRLAKLGPEVIARVRVMDPNPTDPQQLANLGTTTGGVPALVNRRVCEADLLVATGIVEPHQYAGYSGGRKTVAVGTAGEETIEHLHGPAMLDHPRVRLDQIDGNPFHAAIAEIAERAGLRFILNVVVDEAHDIVAVRAGEPRAALAELVAVARSMYTVPICNQVDVAIAGVGYPKDSNLYQASRAASYLHFAPTPVVRRGGVIIVPARAEEGVGAGLGEQRFHSTMRDAPDPAAVIEAARRYGYKAGGQRAYVMARVLQHCEVVVVGAEEPGLVADLKMLPAATMAEALGIAVQRVGGHAAALVVPHALLTLPVVTGG